MNISYVLAGLALAMIVWGLKLAFTEGPGPGLFGWLSMVICGICAGIIIFS